VSIETFVTRVVLIGVQSLRLIVSLLLLLENSHFFHVVAYFAMRVCVEFVGFVKDSIGKVRINRQLREGFGRFIPLNCI